MGGILEGFSYSLATLAVLFLVQSLVLLDCPDAGFPKYFQVTFT